ncbi:MAG: hypothetical protein GX860_07795 [Alcaligenaceae bacterium]|nr:hypothetical protein [Alcaligenaceae bacterium]
MGQKVDIKNVIKMAGAFAAYLIGSGFATGQEILQFFASFGIDGLWGILIITLLFSSFGFVVMRKGHELQLLQPTQIFYYYTGPIIGRLIEIFTLVFIFGIVVIMISGSGALTEEYFKLPSWLGFIGMGILCMITVLLGLNRLVDIIGAIGPVIVVFTVVIGAWIFLRDFAMLGEQPIYDVLPDKAYEIQPGPNAIISGVLYFSYNILAGAIFYTQLGKEANSAKEASLAGILGGLALAVAVLFMVIGMLSNYELVIGAQVPNLLLGNTISPVIAFLFAVVIMLGVYSTAAPMYWLVKNELVRFLPNSIDKLVTIVLGVLFMMGGSLPFGTLIGTIYPFAGYIGTVLVLAIVLKTAYNKATTGRL